MKHGHGKPGSLDYAKVDGHEAHEHGETDAEIEEAETDSAHHAFNFGNMDPSTGYFMEKLVGHQREGFIWQKLREPRSYDFQKAQNKTYNERLRMPQFTAFNDAQREAVITFVLGLVAEPPAAQYVFKANPRRAAIVQGAEVIEKFNCTGCHTLEMERWKLTFDPGDFRDPDSIVDYPFVEPHFSPQQIEQSLATDNRGMRSATITGMPVVDEEGKLLRVDEGRRADRSRRHRNPGLLLLLPLGERADQRQALAGGRAEHQGAGQEHCPAVLAVGRVPDPVRLSQRVAGRAQEQPAGAGRRSLGLVAAALGG